MTAKGRKTFSPLEALARKEVAAILEPRPASEQDCVVRAMQTIEGRLGPPREPRVPFVLRAPRPGEGWVVERHGVLYAREYGWDARFEGLVAGIVAHIVEHFDPKGDRGWIAERDGQNVGPAFSMPRATSTRRPDSSSSDRSPMTVSGTA